MRGLQLAMHNRSWRAQAMHVRPRLLDMARPVVLGLPEEQALLRQ